MNVQQEEQASSYTRQVAKVTPFVDTSSSNEMPQGQADPLSVPEIPSPEPTEVDSSRDDIAPTCGQSERPQENRPTTLRLRNFAVDPSSNLASSPSVTAPVSSSSSSAASFSSSWHLAQGQPEQPAAPPQPSATARVTSFTDAASKFLRISFVLTATDRHQAWLPACYSHL